MAPAEEPTEASLTVEAVNEAADSTASSTDEVSSNDEPTETRAADDDEHNASSPPDTNEPTPSSSFSLRRAFSLMASPILNESGRGESVPAGLFSLFLVGLSIGLVMPKNSTLPSPWYQTVSACIGWIYFLCWSISFYPQVLSNFTRQTTQGLSADFCGLNVLGFACYSVYNGAFFWSETIQKLYRKRFGDDAEITVQSNDVAFALHALILSSITLLQIGYYDGIRKVVPSKAILLILILFICICAGYPCLILLNIGGSANWLDFLYLLSTIKIMISLIKYIPQVILNYQRKSTIGWSIWNIILDFTGGLLSDLQLVGDCMDLKDFSGITGNLAKFCLGSVSIVFDVIFMLQHYVFYAHGSGENAEERLPLLSNQQEATAEVLTV